jgi:hypothetical protein
MKFLPILMSTPMVQAILAGRKTMTRRKVKPQGAILTDKLARSLKVQPPKQENSPVIKCPYGQPGDVLWVRETFCGDGLEIPFDYKANFTKDAHGTGWKPSLFMPKAACRIFLQITNIRVERLQDISESDALAEGIDREKLSGDFEHTPVQEFENLWQSINGEESWEENPFVWVIEFKQIEKPTNF